MTPVISFGVFSQLASKHRNSIMKLEYDINSGAAATVYVQLHDWPTAQDLAAGLTVPANGAVPIKSWPTPAGQTNVYKEFKNGELVFNNGVFAAVSTTQTTLTLGTGSNKFDSVATELWSNDVIGTEVTGQSVFVKRVLSDLVGVAGQYYLIRLSARNLNAGYPVWLQLFAINSPPNGTVPLQSWPLAANTGGAAVLSQQVAPASATYSGALNLGQQTLNGVTIYAGGLAAAASQVGDTIYRDFGANPEGLQTGLFVRSQDSVISPSVTFANHQGITLALSTTETTLTQDTGSGMNVYAEYTSLE